MSEEHTIERSIQPTLFVPLKIRNSEGIELFKITENGDIFLRGVLIGNDKEVADICANYWEVR